MASLLAHIKIQPGKEQKWEAIMHDMVRARVEVVHAHLLSDARGVLNADGLKGAQHVVEATKVGLDTVVVCMRTTGCCMRRCILPERL